MPRVRGLSSTRTGRPSISLQTLIDRIPGQRKRASNEEIDLEEAQRVADVLNSAKSRARRFRDAATIGGVANPFIRAMGRTVEAGINAKKHRGRAMTQAFKRTNPGELVKNVFEGGAGGAAVNYARETIEVDRARQRARQFLAASEKQAARAFGKLGAQYLATKRPRPAPMPLEPLHPMHQDAYDFEV